MLSTKSQYAKTEKFYILILLLVGLLLPVNPAFAQTPTPPSEPLTKQLPANGIRSQNRAAINITAAAPNVLQDPSFEASYGSGAYWGQFSSNFGTPLCIVADCGDGGGTAGPRTGSVWSWFGGIDFTDPDAVSPEVGDVYQDVSFPSCGATLQFYLWIGAAAAGSDANDIFIVGVDGNVVFSANATQKSSYPSYTLVNVDVSAYANGGIHQVEFYSNISGQYVTFNLDDVALISGNCTVSGNAGVAGATLNYTGGSTTADGSGNYSFN